MPVDIQLGIVPDDTRDEVPLTTYVNGLRDRLRHAYEMVNKNIIKAGVKNKDRYDKKVRDTILEKGDMVLMRNVNLRGKIKIADRWEEEPYRVLKRVSDEIPVYVIKTSSGKKRTVHRNLLKPCYDSDNESDNENSEINIVKRRKLRVRRAQPRKARSGHSSDSTSDSESEFWTYIPVRMDSSLDANSPEFVPANVDESRSSITEINLRSGDNVVDLIESEVVDRNVENDIESVNESHVNETERTSDARRSDTQRTVPRRSQRMRNQPQRYGWSSKRTRIEPTLSDRDKNWRKHVTNDTFDFMFKGLVTAGVYRRRSKEKV
jgi:transcription antitermination factor NusG